MRRKLIGQVFWNEEDQIAELVFNTKTLNDTKMLLHVCSDIEVDLETLCEEAKQQARKGKRSP